MSGLAVAADSQRQASATDAKPARKRRIPRRIAEVVRLLTTGECKTQRAAAERTGMSETYVSEALRKPEILAHIEQETRVALSRSQAPAAATLIRLATDAASEHVQKDAAIHLLAMAGHKPAATPQLSVNVEIRAGYVIDISEDQRKPMIDVSPNALTHD